MPRTDRLDSLLRKEISQIIEFELRDPKIGFCTVSEVKCLPDLSEATVYVSFLGKGYMKRDGLEALRRSKGYIKTKLAQRIRIRKIPDLTFAVDDSLDKAERIEQIIAKNNKSEDLN